MCGAGMRWCGSILEIDGSLGGFADHLVWRSPRQLLELLGAAVGGDMRLQAFEIVVVEDLDRGVLMVRFIRSALPLVHGW